jgi:hypothetical protein
MGLLNARESSNNYTMKSLYIVAVFLALLSCSNDKTLKISKEEYGKKWPFSVDEIEIYCSGYKEIYCRSNDGRIYALNGAAKGASANNPAISKVDDIWLNDPEFEGLKLPYAQFITEGLKLCEEN